MDLVSELQALQLLKPVRKRASAPSATWGKPRQAIAHPAIAQPPANSAEETTPQTGICPDTARRLRIRAMAAGAVA